MRGTNPKSLANLRPAKKGEVRNPKGVNKKRPLTDEYFHVSTEPIPEKFRRAINQGAGQEILQKGATWARANALRRFMDAMTHHGHCSSKEIREAIEGKAPQRLEITGPERKEITLVVRYDRRKRTADC